MNFNSISTSAFFDRAKQDMTALRQRAETLQEQLGTGERLRRSSDDPVAASRLRQLSRADSLSDIDMTNANRAATDLTLADSALSTIGDAIIRARELAVQAGNETLSNAQRASIGAELDQIHQGLVSIANSRDSAGHALFGGQAAGDAYEIDGAGNAVYIGTASAGELPLGESQNVKRGLTGPEAFNFNVNGAPTDLMAVVKNLAIALQGGVADPAAAARDALGALSTGIDTLTTGQTLVGTRLAWIDLTTERRIDLAELRAGEEAELGGTDIATTIVELQELMIVLEASQASFTRLSSLNLFDQLR